MSLSIALAGKPNTGKSTFFKAATLMYVEIANYPFTTISANRGTSYVRVPCPCTQLKARCGHCMNGVRFVPIELVDVAGLVPEAHKGRGLGNTFLDNLRQSEAIINVIDASGGTDIEGNVLGAPSHDPLEDITLLESEISLWITGIIEKNWQRLAKKAQLERNIAYVIATQLAVLNIEARQIKNAMQKQGLLDTSPESWEREDIINLSQQIRKIAKPIVIAANKKDIASSDNISRIADAYEDVVATSGEAELALRLAQQKGLIVYVPGDTHFAIVTSLNEQQKTALERLKKFVGGEGTGVQKCLNMTVFDVLRYIVVYPVEDEHRWSDKQGRVLPDALLMKGGGTAKDLAFKVHSDIGHGFLYAIDVRTKKRLGEHHELQNGDIIKIVSTSRAK
ncbi:MAG: redox-regulated ATPase YchF [Euryarchaeota archaeon]|nr:redox-regulated ATPase YchF [Euryarchaeota archaeon]